MSDALQYALAVLDLIAKMTAAGEDVAELAGNAATVIRRGDNPTDAEWESLNHQTEGLERRIRGETDPEAAKTRKG